MFHRVFLFFLAETPVTPAAGTVSVAQCENLDDVMNLHAFLTNEKNRRELVIVIALNVKVKW